MDSGSAWSQFEAAERRYHAALDRSHQETQQLLACQTRLDQAQQKVRALREAIREAHRAGQTFEERILNNSTAYKEVQKLLMAAQQELAAAEKRPHAFPPAIEKATAHLEQMRRKLRKTTIEVLAGAQGKTGDRLRTLTAEAEASKRRLKNAENQHHEAQKRLSKLPAIRLESRQELEAARLEQVAAFKALTDPAQRSKARLFMFQAKHRRRLLPVGATPPNPNPTNQSSVSLPDGRVCPVCGAGGLLPGQYRHQRCEGSARSGSGSPEQGRVEEPPTAVRPKSAEPPNAARYRKLVHAVEERESATYGKRRRSSDRPVRLPQSVSAVLLRCGGRYENPECAGQPKDVTDAGLPLLEVDHIYDISGGGRDHPECMAALCPNCHAVKSRGRGRETLRAVLADVAKRAHQAWMVQQ
ncbi:HNH endonuclease [Kitasatospora sp. NPDC085895]|uniref:HNH endonuclease n=1 Tax=Kitasatospora sp. NPDC085895 TaxID=3155057 RepID=UPI00344CC6A6